MRTVQPHWYFLLATGLLTVSIAGCATLRDVSNLRKVKFQIERVSQTRLAGVDMTNLRSYDELRSADVLRLGAALSEGKLPLSFVLHLQATNPASNNVDARLTEMDWTLLLEEKETVSGRFNREVVLPPGNPKNISLQIKLDLVRFFDDNLQGLVNLASALAGDAPPQTLKLRVQPTVDTALGPFQYPSPITVVSEGVGGTTQQP
jgi:hypothetical protein